MIEPTIPATTVTTPSNRPAVSETAPCSAPSGQTGVACSLKLHTNNDDNDDNDDNDVKCTNKPVTSVPVEHVETVVMKVGAVPVANSMHDETSRVNEILSIAEAARPSDRTSDVRETAEAAATAASGVAQSVSSPPAPTARAGGADTLPKPHDHGGSDGSVDEVLPENKRDTFPRDSAKVLTRAEARRKYGKFLARKWDFETIPHDEVRVTTPSGARRTVKVYKESDLQQAVRKRHGLPIYAFTRGSDNGKPGPSNSGPSAK